MKTCDSFQHNKYWIQPQEPSKEYWYSFVVKYLESTGEVEMSYYYNWDWESIRFKKEQQSTIHYFYMNLGNL